jgi:hypothetical protein
MVFPRVSPGFPFFGAPAVPMPLLNRPLGPPKVAIEQTSRRRLENSSIQGSGFGLSLSVRKYAIRSTRSVSSETPGISM